MAQAASSTPSTSTSFSSASGQQRQHHQHRQLQRRDGSWQKNVLCRYYMNGLCTGGDGCAYSHDRSLANRGTIPCKYYSQGTCAYGNNCRFSHGQPFPPVQSQQQQQQQQQQQLPEEQETVEELSQNFENLGYWDGPPGVSSASEDVNNEGYESQQFEPQGEVLVEERNLSEKPTMTTLTKTPKSWVDAPEFVPSLFLKKKVGEKKSWAEIVNAAAMAEMTPDEAESQLCPFGMVGECRYGEHCHYIHGNYCDLCGTRSLHPNHAAQRKRHVASCLKKHEQDMEFAFAIARSKDKTCGICMEVVMDKAKGEARFGIMPNCNHCFCLSCLRKWRQAKFEHKIIRACPECRQTSDYICPSRYWVDTKEEKEELLRTYRLALNNKECKYFKKGEGECPFGNKCFYRHASADGKIVDVGPPQRKPRRANADGDLTLFQRLILYDFFDQREGSFLLPVEYLELLEFLSDSEDGEWS